MEKPSREICHDNGSKPWAHSSRGRANFASPCCRKGQVQLRFIAPRSPRRGGGEEGLGEEYVVNFAHRIIMEEGPKSRIMGSPWSSQLWTSISAHVLITVYPTSQYHGSGIPSLSVVVIHDPLTIGDIPMCSIGIIDRQSWFPHSGCHGAPRDLRPIACLLRKKADQRAKLEVSFQKRRTGGALQN